MHKTKVCKKCNKELPATEEYYYMNGHGLRGDCKECTKKQKALAYKERRKEGKHLIHDLVCDWCNNDFKSDHKTQRFCSTDCQYAWQRGSKEYKEKYNQFGSPEEREAHFKEKFESMYPNFRYHSEYKGTDDNFKCECRICGHVQKRNASVARSGKELKCDKCNEVYKARKELVKTLHRYLKYKNSEIDKEIKDKVNTEIKALERITKKHTHYIKCSECGRQFFSNRETTTCSTKCSNRRSNRIKAIKRRKRLKENGKIEWDISLKQLYKRDKAICYICGEKCNPKDIEITEKGIYIAGDTYPSIDHVIPVNRGGTHTWDNIKLAHRHCNSVKNDKITRTEESGQLRLIM